MSDLRNMDCGCRESASAAHVNSIYHHLREADAPLAMGYVPFQPWEEPYPLCTALQAGTVFPGLHKPFCGKGGKRW